MKFLNFTDLLEASLVNRTWYEASLDPILQKNHMITFDVPSTDEQFIYKINRRRAQNLAFNGVDSSSHSSTIMVKSCSEFSHNLKSLSFKGTDITKRIFVSFLSHCYSLESLDLTGCNTLFLSGKLLESNTDLQALKLSLGNLKDLNLSSIRHLSDATFNRIVTVMPNLESLNLSSCHMTFHTDSGHSKSKACADSTLLSFANILRFIRTQSQHIKSLDFSITNISNEALSSLAKCDGLELKELHLNGCKELSDAGLVELCKKQNRLTYLDISKCTFIGNHTVSAIVKYLLDLQHLDIRKCECISDSALQELSSLKSCLRSIDMASTMSAPTTLVKIINSPAFTEVTHFTASGVVAINDKTVFSICSNLKQLDYLDINSCFNITDRSVHSISEHLVNLKYLDLSWCRNVTDLGLLGLVAANSHIHSDHDDHTGCRCVRNHDTSTMFRKPLPLNDSSIPTYETVEKLQMEQISDDIFSLANLKKMETLKLKSLPHVTDMSLTQAIKFRDLFSLDISMNKHSTDESLVAIATNNPYLQHIFLSNCKEITNDGILYLVHNLRRIISLDISNVSKVTNHCMKEIAKCCRHLRMLDVSYCTNITQDAIDLVESSCPHIQDLHSRFIGDDTGLWQGFG